MNILAKILEDAAKAELEKEGISQVFSMAKPEMATPEMSDPTQGMDTPTIDSSPTTPQDTPPPVAAPEQVSFGQQIGNIATDAINKQIEPTQSLFKTLINPKSTAGDIGRSAFEYGIKQKEEPSMAPAMNPYSNPYVNMANNTVGGIPSLLQNTQSGLLPFFGAR